MSIRVLLADDHKIVREGIRSLIEKQSDIEVIAEAGDGRTASRMAQEMSPDIVIMDVAMPDQNGIETTRQVIAKNPNIKVIVLSMYSNKRFIEEMLSAGASGYLLKDCAFEELVHAIRNVATGGTYLSSVAVDLVVKGHFHQLEKSKLSAFSILTTREREVLQFLAEGKTIREIAGILCLSIKTIETHRQKLMAKLDIHSLAELIKYALREGLSSLET